MSTVKQNPELIRCANFLAEMIMKYADEADSSAPDKIEKREQQAPAAFTLTIMIYIGIIMIYDWLQGKGKL